MPAVITFAILIYIYIVMKKMEVSESRTALQLMITWKIDYNLLTGFITI